MEQNTLPWSQQTEQLFETDLTTDFSVDDYNINAEVIADTINPATGKRVTTLHLKVPRIILSELNTHRIISKNASSSRAIPAKKLRKQAWDHCFVPVYWGANQKGMAASAQLTGWKKHLAIFTWKAASKVAIAMHKILELVGVHKQTCNRLIEPFMSVSDVITATEWDNFLTLRYNKAAQPEMIVLAKKIHDAIKASTPDSESKIHLPFVYADEKEKLSLEQQIKVSVARCCRTSYANNLGFLSEPEQDIMLYHRLLNDGHMSPFEHVAFIPNNGRIAKELHLNFQRNFRGWYQLRAFIDQPEYKTHVTKMYKDLTNSTIFKQVKQDQQ